MSNASQPCDAAALEQLIFMVRGIQAARVVTSPNGGIDEVHVVGLPGRSAKQIVRDIESILYVRGGVRLDHRKVSLVQIEEGAGGGLSPRLLLVDVLNEPDQAAVTLGLRDRQAQGYCRAEEGATTELMRTGRATVRAIRELIGPQAELAVVQLAVESFGPLRVCLSHVDLINDTGLETLLGISLVRDDEQTAAARAVLDAVNRPLLRLMGVRG